MDPVDSGFFTGDAIRHFVANREAAAARLIGAVPCSEDHAILCIPGVICSECGATV